MASIPIYIYWFIESHAQSAQLRKGNPSLVVVYLRVTHVAGPRGASTALQLQLQHDG